MSMRRDEPCRSPYSDRGQGAQPRPVHADVIHVLLDLRLFGSNLGVPRSHQVLDQHVGGLVLGGVSAIKGHFRLAGRSASLTHVGQRGAEIVQFPPCFGQFVSLDALLVLMHLGQAAARGRQALEFDGFDLEPVAGKCIQKRGQFAVVTAPIERAEAAQPPPSGGILTGH
jgi:hypothetical protein